jgi:hypothetical protein
MAQETEVISCPACKHLLRVPLDWLGQEVQCPECEALFKAPIKIGDQLTAAELISRPKSVVANERKKLDAMLLLPAFGLMLCGVVGALANGGVLLKLTFEKDGGREWAKNLLLEMKKRGLIAPGPPENEDQRIEQDAGRLLSICRWGLSLSLVVSLGVFLGGLSIALQWNYRLAQLGCVLAIINVVHACCIPGTVAGLWGLLMLNSEEAREHFGK